MKPAKETADNSSVGGAQYLTFFLQGDMYAIDVEGIKEIIEYGQTTKVPNMPKAVRGVTNIRGDVIPVVDLGVRLGFGEGRVDKRTSLIITEVNNEGEGIDIGLMVDSVNQVLFIPKSETEHSPSLGVKIRKEFIKEMGKIDDSFIAVLNIHTLLDIEELSA